MHLKHTQTGTDFAKDVLEDLRFTTIAWAADSKGFFYGRYDKTGESAETGAVGARTSNQKIYYHKVGTEQKQDVLVYENARDPDLTYNLWTSVDGRWLIISGKLTTMKKHTYFAADLHSSANKALDKKLKLKPLIT